MFEKEEKYFPKTTDPQCLLKWNWSTLYLTDGTTSSCHRCAAVPINPENFDQFHNLPHKIKERKIMLSGKWPTVENGGSGHCNYCKKVEDAGGVSDRINMLKTPNQVPQELLDNKLETFVTPKILEIFLNDTCNMKCTYCRGAYSSQWKSEIRKHGQMTSPDGKSLVGYTPDDRSFNKNHDYRKLLDKTLNWLERNADKLSRLHLLGGETFYQKELDEVLTVLENTKNTNLELNIVSNLMVTEDRFKGVIDRIKKLCHDRRIGRFDLTASIDGWGPEVEYARTGLKCDHFDVLFQHAVNEKWITLHTNQTVSSMSVRAIPKLLQKIRGYRKNGRNISLRVGSVTNMPHLHPAAFGRDFWRGDVENISKVWPTDNDNDKRQLSQMRGIFGAIKNLSPDEARIKFFKHYLDQLDQRRDTDWRSVFPYLDI